MARRNQNQQEGAEAPEVDGGTVGTAANPWATADGAAPEALGTPEGETGDVTGYEAAVEAGYFGTRRNNHADADYTLPGLVNGASPADRDNRFDAPGGVDWGAGSYTGDADPNVVPGS